MQLTLWYSSSHTAPFKSAIVLISNVISLIQNDMQHGYWQIIIRIVTIRTAWAHIRRTDNYGRRKITAQIMYILCNKRKLVCLHKMSHNKGLLCEYNPLQKATANYLYSLIKMKTYWFSVPMWFPTYNYWTCTSMLLMTCRFPSNFISSKHIFRYLR